MTENETFPFPGREKEAEQLRGLVALNGLAPAVFVYGHAATGKSAVVAHVLGAPSVVDVNTTPTPPLLAAAVAAALAASPHRTVALDHVDAAAAWQQAAVAALLRRAAAEAFGVVVVAAQPRRVLTNSTPCVHVYFAAYSAAQTRRILVQDCPNPAEHKLWCQFVELAQNILQRPCRDLNELRHICALLYPKYILPIKKGRLLPDERFKLQQHVNQYFRNVLDHLYTRRVSSAEWLKDHDLEDSRCLNLADGVWKSGSDLDLPYNTTYLLLASFIASYNPKGLDVRFFARASEKSLGSKKIKKSMGMMKKKKLRQQLLGPKAFPIERMLAIFYRIKEDAHSDQDLESLVDIQMQVTSLVTKGLLHRMSNVARLDEVKCKVNISLETAYALAARVRFDLSKYLHDFKA
ncbi:origin recognition complex subunit 5 C-terminus-domain-containing protein [Obelidium mucronatum]|nr:origin recognition complex subunit 5 C-terminus-domain-containing protein [Obelidium mucronatum]KAI9334715.1 origin recognition complex subunit 5 C-terminus-domain-containing protein [Obelidium mucronatum]KAI9334718.1 origin recognition complex subunit 5 C-terminus-domain-containing protein [Obelidium mucronatum]